MDNSEEQAKVKLQPAQFGVPALSCLHANTFNCIPFTNSTLASCNKMPTYCTQNPIPNLPENNQVQLLEYRGAQLAAFAVEGKELICLPQAFELFLKHLVGGLHTVYTKLKRLEIQPVVCNVEQVRILRGLGAIQPGVNRCKLIAPREFDILYADCTTSSARPGRPSKRTAVHLFPILERSSPFQRLNEDRCLSKYSSLTSTSTNSVNDEKISFFGKYPRLDLPIPPSLNLPYFPQFPNHVGTHQAFNNTGSTSFSSAPPPPPPLSLSNQFATGQQLFSPSLLSLQPEELISWLKLLWVGEKPHCSTGATSSLRASPGDSCFSEQQPTSFASHMSRIFRPYQSGVDQEAISDAHLTSETNFNQAQKLQMNISSVATPPIPLLPLKPSSMDILQCLDLQSSFQRNSLPLPTESSPTTESSLEEISSSSEVGAVQQNLPAKPSWWYHLMTAALMAAAKNHSSSASKSEFDKLGSTSLNTSARLQMDRSTYELSSPLELTVNNEMDAVGTSKSPDDSVPLDLGNKLQDTHTPPTAAKETKDLEACLNELAGFIKAFREASVTDSASI